ncbi:MAG: hypothetical protein OEX18_06420 [Candidatus Krumholzibacteria bacterium]|nr:hypothetical protein [Candidatus Krumholzibacteria bacterium]MDH4336899.1 hypothetical protein [Candidatus Krumholzibacteria bacterium]MDH5269230.1 hypothetical protein [Candidatus Krumholzibacteria bacterium]
MMIKRYLFYVAMLGIAVIPAMASANARLISVTSVSGGCVSGPTGPAVQAWDVEPGETYRLTIDNVAECANGGTDATLNVRVNSSGSGNFDLVATYVADGVYEFDFTMPSDATCTFPIFYCTTPGSSSTGIFVTRNDGGMFQAHLRAATFEPGCTNPEEILGPDCQTVPTENTTWGAVKDHYRK